MFCSNCGQKVPDGSAFCTNCGTPLKAAAPEKQSDITREAPRTPAGGYDVYRAPRKSGGTAGTIITIIGAVLVLVALAWLWIRAGSAPEFYDFLVYILPMIVIALLAIIWAAYDKPHAVLTVALMTIGYYLGSWIYGLDTGTMMNYNYVFMLGAVLILIGGIVGINENKNRG